ncbi:hypothetical protein K523DRAFT_248013 [Schizophyllum commune Tattone D]|nr:hypothetical protein K523DRAFT_248013 [Schizophyllum commune Tattone D]
MAFDHASGATRVETVLGLLAESSVVYCVLWGVLTFVIIRNDRYPNTVTSYEIIAASYHYFAGIYVTLVILVLELQKTFANSLDVSTMVSRGISFAAMPALPGHDTIMDDSYDSGTQPSATVRGSRADSLPMYTRVWRTWVCLVTFLDEVRAL